jgi:hypothetical protein
LATASNVSSLASMKGRNSDDDLDSIGWNPDSAFVDAVHRELGYRRIQ